MNKTTLKLIRIDINESLATIGKKHDISLKTVGSTTYTNTSFKMRIEGGTVNEDGIMENEVLNFKRCAGIVGLSPDDLGRGFVYKGESYKITGIKLNRPKYPIQTVNSKGKNIKFNDKFLLTLLK